MTIVEEPLGSGTMSVLGRLLFELDPRVLLDNPLNPRAELGDVSAEAASMRECGVLEPLIVVPAPGNKFMILCGHRRRAAAIEAGLATVPCDVRPEYVDLPPEQLADMLAENLHRQDLSALDEAGGYAQLAMFDGWNPERIARRLGRTVDRVRAGIAASEIRPELRPQVVDGAVTLEQAAAIEEFAADEKAYARLVRAAQYPPGLHHALADERHRRTVEQRKETTRAGLRDANVRIIAKPANFRYGSVELGVEELTDARGVPLTVEEHSSCPGNAAFVGAEGEAVFVCQHPKEWGHDVPGHYRHQSKAEIQAQEEAAQADREYQTALTVADDARASFLTDYLTRKGRPPAGTLRTALMILCRFNTGAEPRVVAARLLHPAGPDAHPYDSGRAEAALLEAAARSADNRLPYLALAYAAAAGETNLRRRGGWSHDAAFAVHWLDVIAGLGYPLSNAEVQLRQHALDELADLDTDDDTDEDTEDDGDTVPGDSTDEDANADHQDGGEEDHETGGERPEDSGVDNEQDADRPGDEPDVDESGVDLTNP